MKVLMINGSPKPQGNTFLALEEVGKGLRAEGADYEIVWIGNKAIQGCIACYKCRETGVCIFPADPYAEIRSKLDDADGIIIGSPVYYAGPSGSLCALLDRLFFSCGKMMAYKPAASVCVARRGGASSAFDRLNKYFTINNMPVVSSQYWNMAYGLTSGEVMQDGEGLQTMRILGRNMAWMLRKLHTGDPDIPAPEEKIATNFIR